jgi:aminoglycoside/choline kinase family phosphotransferase
MNAMATNITSQQEFYPFLTESLGTENFQVFSLAGDASTRRYYRVVVDDVSWVLMRWDPFVDDDNYPFLSVLAHFAKNGVNVPKVKAKSPELGYVLLEDLGDLTLERKFWENSHQTEALVYYRSTIDELLKIHYTATEDKTNCTAFKVAFDTEKLLWEMNYAREHVLLKFRKAKLTDAESKCLDETFLKICNTLSNEPRVICHRDFHSRNVMLKLGKLYVIDFQDARMGSIQYDLVSITKDAYVNLSASSRESILDYYLARTSDFGAKPISRENFHRIFEIQSIQRCFKACGSFTSFYNMRQDTRYLKYMAQTLNDVKTSLALFPEYNDFTKILEDHGVFDHDYIRT